MRFMRALLAWLSVPFLCFLGFFLCLARPFNPDNTRILGAMVARTGRRVLGLTRPLDGYENMPQNRPTVIIANHQHNDDLFLMGDLLPKRTVAVGKASLRWIPFFGQVFWLGGNILIDRTRSSRAVAVIRTTAEAMTRERKSIWIFPEGTRSHGSDLQSFKKGAFHAAVAAGAPITMVCAGAYRSQSSGVLGRRKPVPLRILPPVETRHLTADDVPELMKRCHAQMSEAIRELAAAPADSR
ncbi:lysophospholipid acyltransferase family protein [Marinobacter bohaiensis]|uniref:lysophospholipid acyltransferase family protein n=1 Tax=Marinobacter bohaiensis TaxID=2201898 RepID=UPI000DAEB5F5|nr:1-acylglycerol-3-phosphate O-acyltransferase [Marinobacter bohaiensis]